MVDCPTAPQMAGGRRPPPITISATQGLKPVQDDHMKRVLGTSDKSANGANLILYEGTPIRRSKTMTFAEDGLDPIVKILVPLSCSPPVTLSTSVIFGFRPENLMNSDVLNKSVPRLVINVSVLTAVGYFTTHVHDGGFAASSDMPGAMFELLPFVLIASACTVPFPINTPDVMVTFALLVSLPPVLTSKMTYTPSTSTLPVTVNSPSICKKAGHGPAPVMDSEATVTWPVK